MPPGHLSARGPWHLSLSPCLPTLPVQFSNSAATTCVSPGLAPSSRLAGGVCEGLCALDAHMPRGVLSLPCQAGTWAAHGFSMAVAKSLRMPGAWVTFTLTTTNTSRCPPVTGASACSRSGSPGCVREVWRAGALGQGPQRESSPGTCPRASEHAPWALAMVPWVSPCTPWEAQAGLHPWQCRGWFQCYCKAWP